MQDRTKRIVAIIAALMIGGLAGARLVTALDHDPPSRWVTLPTAYDIGTGRYHAVDPLDCRVSDPTYSGAAVCSQVRNP